VTTEWDRIPERGRALEDEYFRRRDREIEERARERTAEERRRRQFAAAVGIDDDPTLIALREAGVDEHTAELIQIVPAVYVAWADGHVSDAERREIDLLAERRDLQASGSPGRQVLAWWLEQRPSDGVFAAAFSALQARLQQLDKERRAQLFNGLIADAILVGEISGGVLGFGAVSDAEARCIRDLKATLTVGT
jgi:prepilin-type processing-associated H-X9-DG protein